MATFRCDLCLLRPFRPVLERSVDYSVRRRPHVGGGSAVSWCLWYPVGSVSWTMTLRPEAGLLRCLLRLPVPLLLRFVGPGTACVFRCASTDRPIALVLPCVSLGRLACNFGGSRPSRPATVDGGAVSLRRSFNRIGGDSRSARLVSLAQVFNGESFLPFATHEIDSRGV